MDSLGSEVGHKMRSAVKAKLIELGSGTSAGYIDDELPDYVMIMVANKRSKEQMTEDLSLFLGKNTDAFVSWLHQVLEKLQEVTLPSTAAQKSKRKMSESTSDKKDKKGKAKKRTTKEKTPDKEATVERSTTPPMQATPVIPSITDVFANHLIQKAKHVIEPPLSVKMKAERSGSNNDGFDIPTISEIAKNAVGAVVCRKEITELAELQKKIDQAKRQLKHMTDESEDEDFINLKADRNDLLDANEYGGNSKESVAPSSMPTKEKPPNTGIISTAKHNNAETAIAKSNTKAMTNDDESVLKEDKEAAKITSASNKKRSILERLGTKGHASNENIVSLSANRRMEQAIYVPAHRRATEPSKRNERERERERERSPERSDRRVSTRELRENRLTRENRSNHNREANETRDLREKVRQRERDLEQRSTRANRDVSRERTTSANSNKSESKQSSSRSAPIVNRIGSRVIVAPTKPDYNEDDIEVPVNSVVKVQPRPLVPKSKQASKNLLLRAVAEAQKSTALAKPREFKQMDRTTELYTKSYRKNLQKDNIVVEIESNQSNPVQDTADDDDDDLVEFPNVDIEEEYVPTSESNEDENIVYIPQSVHNELYDEGLDEINNTSKTQFVVTLDSVDYRGKKRPLQVDRKENDSNSVETPKRTRLETKLNERVQSPRMHSPRIHSPRIHSPRIHSPRIHSPLPIQKVNKLIIKNDTEDEEDLRKEVESSKRLPLKRKRTPIKFDIEEASEKGTAEKRISRSRERKAKTEGDSDRKKNTEEETKHDGGGGNGNDRRRDTPTRDHDEGGEPSLSTSKIRTSKNSAQKKYDNLPPLSSAITVTSSEGKSLKKEHCKFYPSCGKGERCEFLHPSMPCKAFPNCKFGDLCLYVHPKCKFDLTCSRLDCNFSHTAVATAAPPLSSHVVPVSNYKKIVATPLPTLCRFYPNCSNTLCEFYHPKPCKFGKNCTNKVECNFYHFDLPTSVPSKNKLKWVASPV